MKMQTFSLGMGSYVQITIETRDQTESEILVAELSECGFEGFEESGYILYAYAEENVMQEDCLEKVLSTHGLEADRKILPQVNWNESWEKNFQPVQVEDYCYIRADFHPPGQRTLYEVVITPKMSFGTGHHPTTFMMVKAMKSLEFHSKSILDFGTGTGLLAILGEKAGASSVLAIDRDRQSMENARENIERNDCHRIGLRLQDSLDHTGEFDVILANLNRQVILGNLADMRQHLLPAGVLIISGLLTEDLPEIEARLASSGMILAEKFMEQGWICLVVKRREGIEKST